MSADRPESIAEWTEHLHREACRVREARHQMLIQPKPWWVPKPVYYWLIRQILVIVETSPDSFDP
jgi:hypothetical protein